MVSYDEIMEMVFVMILGQVLSEYRVWYSVLTDIGADGSQGSGLVRWGIGIGYH